MDFCAAEQVDCNPWPASRMSEIKTDCNNVSDDLFIYDFKQAGAATNNLLVKKKSKKWRTGAFLLP